MESAEPVAQQPPVEGGAPTEAPRDRDHGDREGGRGRGFGGRGGRGGAGGRGGPRGPRDDKDAWVPMTKLGRLVKYNHIKSLEEIYTHSIPIKEH